MYTLHPDSMAYASSEELSIILILSWIHPIPRIDKYLFKIILILLSSTANLSKGLSPEGMIDDRYAVC